LSLTKTAAALRDGYQITGSSSPVFNYRRSVHMRIYWVMLVFNFPVTKYR